MYEACSAAKRVSRPSPQPTSRTCLRSSSTTSRIAAGSAPSASSSRTGQEYAAHVRPIEVQWGHVVEHPEPGGGGESGDERDRAAVAEGVGGAAGEQAA